MFQANNESGLKRAMPIEKPCDSNNRVEFQQGQSCGWNAEGNFPWD